MSGRYRGAPRGVLLGSFDKVMGYHHIELEKGEGPKMAFSTKQ